MGNEVEQIKDKLSIAEVVGEYAQLKPAGKNLKALCPFHSEKTPSFFISPQRGTWHCFGSCGEGGDIFSFIQKAEGVDFPTALRLLAERAGVTIEKSYQAAQTTSRRQRLLDLMQHAANFYHQVLITQAAGKKAKEYLAGRGVSDEAIATFQIGYAPDSWDILQQALRRKGYTEQEMVAAGMVGRSNRGSAYDRFRGRIMFPVHDSRGRVIAFGGRIVPWLETGNEGKYVNSPETELYEKRVTVYNLNRAKEYLRKGSPCLVVEGYMDVVMLVQAGIPNVVATSGTAFTSGHVSQLSRYTDMLHFAFDADAAGFSATVSATQAALQAGMKVATIVLPSGKDPADVAKDDVAAAKELFSQTRSLVDVLLAQLKAASMEDRQKNLEALAPLIKLVKNPVQQGAMIEQAAASLHVPEDRVVELVQQSYVEPSIMEPQVVVADTPGITFTAEHYMVGLVLSDAAVRQALFSSLQEDFFLDASVLRLYNSLKQQLHTSSEMSLPLNQLINLLPADTQTFASGLAAVAEERLAVANATPLQEGQMLVRALRRRSLQKKLSDLQLEISQYTDSKRLAALERFRAVSRELSSIEQS